MSSAQVLSFSREKAAERTPKARKAGFKEMLIRNWYLGFTAFGGPAVHFQIVWLSPPLMLSRCFVSGISARLEGIETDCGDVGVVSQALR